MRRPRGSSWSLGVIVVKVRREGVALVPFIAFEGSCQLHRASANPKAQTKTPPGVWVFRVGASVF